MVIIKSGSIDNVFEYSIKDNNGCEILCGEAETKDEIHEFLLSLKENINKFDDQTIEQKKLNI